MYRFNLNGTQVECDSAHELIEALAPSNPSHVILHSVGKTPTTPERRAKKTGGKHAASRSWDIAKFYSAKRGVKFGAIEARKHLAANPDKKQQIENEMIDAGLLQPVS